MLHTIRTRQAVRFLLGLVDDEDTAERVRTRTGLSGSDDPSELRGARLSAWFTGTAPVSLLLWVLEEDDPELNTLVWRHPRADEFFRRAIARGVPFGAGRTAPVAVEARLRGSEPPVPEAYTRYGLAGALAEGTSMAVARRAASMVLTADDWAEAARADAAGPLPGYTRWALAVRPDCPPALRARFGDHPKFTHRVRRAGVLAGPASYATGWEPAGQVLSVLTLGAELFPRRVGEAEDALRPLVRDHLGDREEAWAVLAQVVDTFHGTVPELMITSGALA
ncbi:hypothetical protein [Streptomyces sp. NPDC088789]|uniref:hypothetical protein n=1 Tax=Streptomyces sp. NPDC088789 TaxID=3365899 RepID=UPI00381EB99E